MTPDPRDFCGDCHTDVFEALEYNYMVTLPVWSAARGKGLLCIGCIEARLGRQLVASDFSNAPVNWDSMPHSQRLTDRLRGKVFLRESQMPRAIAIDRYLAELEIRFDQEGLSSIHGFALRVRFTRGGRTCGMVIPTGSSSRAGAIDMIVGMRRLRRYEAEGFSAGLMRHIRRNAGRAEIVLRTLFSKNERDRLYELIAVSTIE